MIPLVSLLLYAGCGSLGEDEGDTRLPPLPAKEVSAKSEQSQPATTTAPTSKAQIKDPLSFLKNIDYYPAFARLRGAWKLGEIELDFGGLLGHKATVTYPDKTKKTGWLKVESPCRVAVALEDPPVRLSYSLALAPQKVYLGRGDAGARLSDGRFYVEIAEGVLLSSGEKECQFYRNTIGEVAREAETVACALSTRKKRGKRASREAPVEPEEETIFTYAIPRGRREQKGVLLLLGDALVSEELQESSAEFLSPPAPESTSTSVPAE